MLHSLSIGKEDYNLILIKDSIDADGYGLLKSLLVKTAERVDQVYLVSFENASSYLINDLPTSTQSRIICHDCFSDPLQWKQRPGSTSINHPLLECIGKHIKSNEKTLVVLDCISQLILHRQAAYTCQVLHGLCTGVLEKGTESTQVMALVHTDLHNETTLGLLDHVASTVISMNSPGICSTVHKKKTGKVLKVMEKFNINESYMLSEVEEITSTSNLNIIEPGTDLDPTANLTFNLTLSEKEKIDRSQTQLPYVKSQSIEDVKIHGTSKIYYQPDEADDIDDEDPDDDLDI